jgi:hypothetical protein
MATCRIAETSTGMRNVCLPGRRLRLLQRVKPNTSVLLYQYRRRLRTKDVSRNIKKTKKNSSLHFRHFLLLRNLKRNQAISGVRQAVGQITTPSIKAAGRPRSGTCRPCRDPGIRPSATDSIGKKLQHS